ncbi:MAG: hypothetical protein K2G88_10280 [Oscillospiraceae bacterium]|nr:hypothetical protein [Oscillospiraceae bacterium]
MTSTTKATTTTTAPENAELVIPIDALNMNESVTVTLKGEPNQKIEPEFDFSATDLNQNINNEINAAPEQLDENGEYEFVFEAPWDMNPFSIRIEYSGSPITYTVKYDRKQEDSPVFTEGGDNWSFANSSNYFGSNYFINEDYKNRLFGNLSNVEKETVKKKMQRKWGGSCFGMAITSILASNNILIPSDYQNGTNFLHDITAPPTENTISLINYYYFLQYTNAFQQEITNTRCKTNKENLETLIQCVQDSSPTLLCFYYGVNGSKGHAVVAYGIERAKYSKDGKAYDTKIMIYDNNKIDYDNDYCLYINTSDYSWTIPYYKTDKYSQSAIALVSDDITFINQNGYLDGTESFQKRDYIAIMNSAKVTSDFMVSKIDLNEDTWSINSTSDDDIKLFYSFDAESTESDLMFALLDSTSGYTMQLENAEAQDLSIQYENCLLSADTSNSDNIVFDPSGYIEVSGIDTEYTLSMTFNEEHYENDWYKISVLGNHADTVQMTKTTDGYLLKSDALNQITISVSNDTVNAVKSFSTDADQVLIYEIDEKTIGIKADSDVVEYTSGDVTGDSVINAEDASQILSEAAALGAGKNPSFTKVQNYSADVNNDNTVNAEDASFILQYAAYQGVGGTDALQIFYNALKKS